MQQMHHHPSIQGVQSLVGPAVIGQHLGQPWGSGGGALIACWCIVGHAGGGGDIQGSTWCVCVVRNSKLLLHDVGLHG